MNLLSRKEELILLAIWKLADNAYGITIRDEISEVTGIKWLFGSIYTPIRQLYEKGLIVKSDGKGTINRGGRSKVYFRLTNDGKEALANIREFNTALWANVPPLTVK